MILRTAKGTEINCESVVKGVQYPVLHIYTHDITPVEAYQIFGDPEATNELTVIEEIFVPIEMENKKYVNKLETREKVYHGFTEIYSVQKSSLYTQYENEILIWLQRKIENPD